MEAIEHLKQIEEIIRAIDGPGIEARWASGQYLLTLKVGKQLPKGVLDGYAETLGVHRSDLSARMKFAAKFPTEAEVSTAIETFGSWSNIRQNALTDKVRPKAAKQPLARAAKLVAAFRDLDPIELTPELLKQLRELIARHEENLETLGMGRAA